ncbi:MAG: MFS transporter [Chthonomonadales bacterium]
MLWFICFFNYADRQAIFSIFPLLKREYGFNDEELGRIGTAFMIVYALSAPFAGQVADRLARKLVIIGGLAIWSAVTGFTAACSRVWHFTLVRGVEGLGETFYFPASMSLLSDYHSGRTRSTAMSLHQTSVYVGTIGGGALAGWMALHHGWRAPFIFLAGAGILLAAVLAFFIREPLRDEATRTQVFGRPEVQEDEAPVPMGRFLREWARTPTAVVLILAFFGANAVAGVILMWMPTFLNRKFHLNVAAAGLGATFFIQISSMIGSAVGGGLADHWRRMHPGGRILVQGFGILLGAPWVFLCGYTRDFFTLGGAMSLFGLCKGLYDSNIWAALYDVIPVSRRAAAVGVMNLVGWTGAALGGYAVGRAAEAGITMSAAIASTGGVYLVVAALLFWGGFFTAPRDART